MKIITYLGFTLVSILVQFCVMDYIQERLQVEEKPIIFNISSQRKQFRDILREYTNKPHALYYRTRLNRLTETRNVTTAPAIYSNSSILNSSTTTEAYSTTFEVLYDESGTVADTDITTDSFYTTTEIDNVTEFVLFETKNKTRGEPNAAVPKRTSYKNNCVCNFLYKVCDINCCCDVDCSEMDIKLFMNCNDKLYNVNQDVCYPQFGSRTHPSTSIDNFLCIAKTNLPEKRNINIKKYDPEFVTRTKEITLKWQKKAQPKNDKVFMKKPYSYGDPLWLLRNNSIIYLETSSPVVNNYCNGRKLIQFLKEENIVCTVKLTHLEMIQILNTIEETCIVSVIDQSYNATILNCSTLHCTNWTVIVCEDASCTSYNKSKHEPFCTDSKCTFIALKMDYIFYYHNFKIVNATIRLYAQNVSMMLPFMTQEISVRFYLANESIDHAIQFSGTPGYVHGLPVIASFVEANHTKEFFKNNPLVKHLALPTNEDGNCVISHFKENALKFGLNTRTKCRLYFEHIISSNGTNMCKLIYKYIYEYLRLNNTIFVSPTGNPHDKNDEDWLPVHIRNIDKEVIYGELFDGTPDLICYNIATKIFLVFTYADKSNIDTQIENVILSADVEIITQNITFNMDDLSTVLTIDTTFIDVTKPPVYEFAGSPDLNIHLPRDFFFPFSNRASVNISNSTFLTLCIYVVYSVSK